MKAKPFSVIGYRAIHDVSPYSTPKVTDEESLLTKFSIALSHPEPAIKKNCRLLLKIHVEIASLILPLARASPKKGQTSPLLIGEYLLWTSG